MRLIDCDFHAKTARGLQGQPMCNVVYDIRHVSVDHGNKLPTSVLTVKNNFGCVSNSVFNGFYEHKCKYACMVHCVFPPGPKYKFGKLRVEGHGPAPLRQVTTHTHTHTHTHTRTHTYVCVCLLVCLPACFALSLSLSLILRCWWRD